MNRDQDNMKQRCHAGFVLLGVRNTTTPPENTMPTKKNNWPTGLQNKPVGSKNWYQIFSAKGRRPRQKWIKLRASSLPRALIERGRLIADYESGAFDPWQAKVDEVTLDQAAAQYLKTKAGLAHNSILSKKAALDLFIKSIPTEKRPAEVDLKDFKRFFDRAYPNLKASSKKTRLAELSQFFKWCQKQGYASTNPATIYKEDQAESLSNFERNREKREGLRRGAIMPRAMRKLTVAISTLVVTGSPTTQPRHALMRDLVTFAMATGLRRSELANLCREDVRLGPTLSRWPDTGGVDVVCWEDPATGRRFRTKNGLDRFLRLVPVAAQIAARHKAMHETEDEYAPLFRCPRGQRLKEQSLTQWFAEYRKEAGLPASTSFHSLRHSFASYLLMMGVDVLLIQSYLGHSSLKQMEHYAKAAERYLRGDAQTLRREILKLFCPDLSPAAVEELLPARVAFSKTITARGLHRRRSTVAIEDTLFDGAAYEVEAALAQRATAGEPGRNLPVFIAPLLTP